MEDAISRGSCDDVYQPCEMSYKPGLGYSRYSAALRQLIPVRKTKVEKAAMPVDKVGMLSFTTFSWMTSIMWKAYRKGLKVDDLPRISPLESCEYNARRLEFMWTDEVKRHGLKHASFRRAVWRFIRTRIFVGMSVFVMCLIMGLLGPTVFMRRLLEFAQDEDAPLEEGIWWTVGLIACEVLRVLFFTALWGINYRTGIRLRSACLTVLYRKLMKLPSLGDKSVGQVVNLFANDAQRIFDLCVFGPLIIGGPVIALGGVIYIGLVLGPYALFGMIAFILFYPLQFMLSRITGYLRRRTIVVTDRRVQLMHEILAAIKLIKQYAWEATFVKRITAARSSERSLLQRAAYVQSVSIALAPTVPVISAIITFLCHVGAGYNLTAAQAFAYLALMPIIEISQHCIAYGAPVLAEGLVVLSRMKSILLMEEQQPYVEVPSDVNQAVVLQSATLAWDAVGGDNDSAGAAAKNKDANGDGRGAETEALRPALPIPSRDALIDIDLVVPKGTLVGICGPVGAGKSSLLSAVLGLMRLRSGQVALDGSCAYVGQQPWILNATLKENIRFGHSFDAKRYFTALRACSLHKDVTTLPGGDETEIGERGINLSGGQKQRVALARALYADREIYLLDDPLAAVDSHVGKHIFQEYIKTALKDKTVLFVTHQLQYLSQCDTVCLLKEGRVVESGTHAKLMSDAAEYAALISTYVEEEEQDEAQDGQTDTEVLLEVAQSRSGLGLTEEAVRRASSEVARRRSSHSADGAHTVKGDATSAGAQLTNAETLEKGAISGRTYKAYIQAGGGFLMASLVMMVFIVNVASAAFSSWWLSHWLEQGSGNTTIEVGNQTMVSDRITDHPRLDFYQLVYGLSVVTILATSLIRGFFFMRVTLAASSRLHDRLFHRVLRAPMALFDTTPVGRLLNLFSRDLDEIDVRLPFTTETFLQNSLMILTSLFFVAMVFPWFLVPLAVIAAVFLFVRAVFSVGVRDLKRLENVTRAPTYSHVITTVNGLATIHAFGKEREFINRFMGQFDDNSSAFYLFNCSMRWVAIRLDSLTVTITALTSVFVLASHGVVPAAFAGLAMAYAAQLSGLFQFTVRLSSETEARFTSVERIDAYTACMAQEAPAVVPSNRPAADWPQAGRVSFSRVCLRYRPELPQVLKNVTFDVHAQEKIGIVGRTGSGKSSIGVALFRLVEPEAGRVLVDGVDVSTVGLADLRSRLSIIPQDPVLFLGTVRYNLDPFDHYSDAQVWQALERTHMKQKVAALELQLQAPVLENGENFSVGERQLICMARALLRHSKILLMDEATASIDTETDSLIQTTIREAFSSCTVLTIAHRLNTVLASSRVLVLDAGQVVEFGKPSVLLAHPNSMFAAMVAAANAATGSTGNSQLPAQATDGAPAAPASNGTAGDK
ncbi:multidrug resistance-associated protein 5-like isoform X2 [Amphibalanus amphitrite]|uniref:multidrug resistance-associated protein 5-like isoform X2 n=1 Tax=Amphibalanus amphitrite TaxID=1232801 RepID=UPI001C91BCD8|nr:multidrug resistance-associated protein 5-like isoform X2 [Amphibalanus amphitrite]